MEAFLTCALLHTWRGGLRDTFEGGEARGGTRDISVAIPCAPEDVFCVLAFAVAAALMS